MWLTHLIDTQPLHDDDVGARRGAALSFKAGIVSLTPPLFDPCG